LDIWDERIVFGSRGQALKEELFGRNSDKQSVDAKRTSYKLVRSFSFSFAEKVYSYNVKLKQATY
jgi:hypothetical protein